MKAEATAAQEQYAIAAGSQERYWDLSELLADWVSIELAPAQQINGLSLDSRRVKPGVLFFACCGRRQSGHDYISAAVDRGAVAVVYDPRITIPTELRTRLRGQGIPLVPLPNAGALAGRIAARFYAQPSCRVRVAGVTGTNGKTSVSHFLAQALHQQKAPCGLMGTLGVGLAGAAAKPSELTTPDAVTIQEQLAEMRDAGAPWAVMEVSSHALDQGRVSDVIFDTAIFTNLSRDHLDYHGDMASYEAAKARLFREGELRHAVINVDDPVGCALLANLPAGVAAISYGLTNPCADLRADTIRCSRLGMAMDIRGAWGEGDLHCSLLGRFNAYNLLAALGGLLAAGIPFDEALRRLSQTWPVVGRMESFGGQEKEPLVVVDYAHTPDALEQALRSLRAHLNHGQLWCVFGCGGSRDRGKRPLMGAIAESLADFVVLTDDNPRDEDPIQIIIDTLAGIDNPDSVYKFRSRAEAIARAVQLAGPKDIVLIAGKGHEDYQQVGFERRPYSDREQVQQALRQHQQRLRVRC